MTAFPNGAVTLSFDDGWRSVFENAYPILEAEGMKSTHFIISGCLDDEQFPRYMNLDQVRKLAESGHEIGCHTASHKHLTEESDGIIREEVILSRKYLEKRIGSVTSFAYPFGQFDERIIEVVKEAGFVGARSVRRGFNDIATDPFLLRCQAVKVSTQLQEVERWIDTARDKGVWLILMFHQIDTEGRAWSYAPEDFRSILRYLAKVQNKVITMNEGLGSVIGKKPRKPSIRSLR